MVAFAQLRMLLRHLLFHRQAATIAVWSGGTLKRPAHLQSVDAGLGTNTAASKNKGRQLRRIAAPKTPM
jgi:hypothetical protein